MVDPKLQELAEEYLSIREEAASLDRKYGNALFAMAGRSNLHTFDADKIKSAVEERKDAARKLLARSYELREMTRGEVAKLKEGLSFWDKIFGGIFGDKDTFEDLKRLENLLSNQEKTTRWTKNFLDADMLSNLAATEKQLIHEELISEDHSYSNDYSKGQTLRAASDKLARMAREADEILNDIENSEELDVSDIFMDSKNTGAASTTSTSSTNDRIRAFQEDVEEFYRNPKELSALNVANFSGDMSDIGGGFDLLGGPMHLGEPRDAKEKIEKAKTHLERERDALSKEAERFRKRTQAKVLDRTKL